MKKSLTVQANTEVFYSHFAAVNHKTINENDKNIAVTTSQATRP